MGKIKDKVMLGLMVGFLGNIPKTFLCSFLNNKGISKIRCSDLSASLFLPSRKVFTKEGRLFGLLCDFITASFGGIAYIYFLTKSGSITRGHALIKGFISGIFSFFFFRGVVEKLGSGKSYPKDIKSNLILGLNSTLWGLAAGLLAPFLASSELLEKR